MEFKGFIEKTKEFLRINTSKTIEQLQEDLATQKILLEKGAGNSNTIVSSIGRESKKIEDPQGLLKKRVPVKELQLLYLNNQLIFRGINVRADEIVTRGYQLIEGDEKGTKACQELVSASGGDNLFWQYSVNTDVAGDGYLESVTNKSKTKIVYLRHVNPINFGWLTSPDNSDVIVLNNERVPKAYMQRVYTEKGEEKRIEVPKEKISHLKFNTFGDEFNGVSSIQPVYNTAIRLMNMEQAAAEAAVKTANPTWVIETQSKSQRDLGLWAGVMGRVSAKEVVFLPFGVKAHIESPGLQNFSSYSDYFMDSVVAALGVPKAILTGSSGSDGSNRATTQTLSKHFYSIIRANQRYIEEIFNKIFIKYAMMAGFKAPKLKFNDIAEDADRNGQRAQELFVAGIVTLEESREMIGLETTAAVKTELENKASANINSGINPDAEKKKDDAKAWHGPEPGSPAGSQKNEKAKKRIDPDVKSVR